MKAPRRVAFKEYLQRGPSRGAGGGPCFLAPLKRLALFPKMDFKNVHVPCFSK